MRRTERTNYCILPFDFLSNACGIEYTALLNGQVGLLYLYVAGVANNGGHFMAARQSFPRNALSNSATCAKDNDVHCIFFVFREKCD